MTILVACGLRREAGIAARAGLPAVAGGGDAGRLERDLRARIAEGGVRAILSSGLAGALDPALRTGDLIVGYAAACARRNEPIGRVPISEPDLVGDRDLIRTLRDHLQGAVGGGVVGSDVAIGSVAAKRDLFALTHAQAVDMETHVAAHVAAQHRLPFAVLRAISDDADHALPPAALVGMRPDGGMAVGAVVASLMRDPRQLPALVRTAIGAEKAFRALACAYDALGRAGIGLADLG